MAIGTYSELKTSAADWLIRADLTARIPDFITLCEAKFNRDLRCVQMETRSYTTADTTDDEPEFISLPDDFQTMRWVRLSGVTGKPRLEYLTGQQADDYRYGSANTAGQPAYFTLMGTEMELIPTPSQDYEIEMVYRATIPALSDSNTTNWLLTLAPDAYLYGTLMQAAPYLKEDDRIALWAQGYAEAVGALNNLTNDHLYTSLRGGVQLQGPVP